MTQCLNSKLALGTAQFGLDYGITNLSGKVDKSIAHEILALAIKRNITTLDTAESYGDSHKVLSDFSGLEHFEIITKLSELSLPLSFKQFKKNIELISRTFKRKKLDFLLLHRPNQLFRKDGENIWKALMILKHENLIGKIGCSVYDPQEAKRLINNFDIDLIQCPYNLFDRRIESFGIFDLAKKYEVQIHVRSIFLQGILLLDSSNIPEKFSPWKSCWLEFEKWLEKNNLNKLEMLINFALLNKDINKVIVGITSSKEVEQILASINANISFEDIPFFTESKELIDPRLW